MNRTYRKKQRGQKRKLRALLKEIDNLIPFQNTERVYEHFHVPSSTFIQSRKTSGKVKTAFCEKWLREAEKFFAKIPNGLDFCKVVAMIDEDYLWHSQIIIFYDKEYYDAFFDRSGREQTWEKIEDKDKSFVKGRNISTALQEQGYMETMYEDGKLVAKSVLWFYEV